MFGILSEKIYEINTIIFNLFVLIVWVLVILSFTKTYDMAPKYLEMISSYIRFYVCLFLLVKFNPFYTFGLSGFTELDKRIVYSSALIILTTDTDFLDRLKKYTRTISLWF